VREISTSEPPRRKRLAAAPRPPRSGADPLNPAEAAFVLGLSTTTLSRLRMTGSGPSFLRPSARVVRYHRADLLAWLGATTKTVTEANHRDALRSAALVAR